MTRFTDSFEKKVKQTIEKYDLATKKEKIIVACSGGKDSTTTLYLLKKFGYNIEAFHINLGIGEWSKKNLSNAQSICKRLGVMLHITNIKDEICKTITELKENRCRICSINKRYILNKKARELGGEKLAIGHNLDDEAESIMMNLLRGNLEFGLGAGPKTGLIKDKKFVQRIKPLFFCTNKETRRYSKEMEFPVLLEPCPHSAFVYRRQIRNWLNKLETKDKNIKRNIVKWHLNKLPELKKKHKKEQKLRYCRICGEPTRNDICKRCELLI
ncbi:TIGR00269 family protein [Candidatus Woesearchaeota archaeon]|nr:MAG: TIGR00269 family protein [Candidatus Woesearchaeota archaeon]